MKRAALPFAILAAALAWLFCPISAYAQCTKDIECKGDRVCVSGQCVDITSPPPPPRYESDEDRDHTERDEDGERPEPKYRYSKFVSTSGFRLSGALLPSSGLVYFAPGVGVHGQWGGRITETVALVGALNGDYFPAQFGSVTIASIAPGVRLGRRHHVTLSVGPEFNVFSNSSTGSTASFFSATGRIDLVFVVTGQFSLQFQGAVHASGSSQILTAGIGLGWSRY